MSTVEEMWPDLAPKTLGQLANDLGVSEKYLWRFINAHDLPWPLQIESGEWVYSPFAYKAALEIMESLLKDYPFKGE
jgi:hypothetical protein